jgi:hypothetical protein
VLPPVYPNECPYPYINNYPYCAYP